MEAVFAASLLLYFQGNSRGFVWAATTVAKWSLQRAETATLVRKASPSYDIVRIKPSAPYVSSVRGGLLHLDVTTEINHLN